MTLSSYSGLVTTIGNWLNRSDLAGAIPSFVTLAEAHFNRVLRTADQEAETTLTAWNGRLALPDDLLEIRALTGFDGLRYAVRPGTQEQAVREDPGLAGGVPRVAVISGGSVALTPPAGDGAAFDLVYYARIPALSDSNPTNWLLDRHPDAYLYGTLVHAGPYLGQDPRLEVWAQILDLSLMAIQAADKAKRWPAGIRTQVMGVTP